MKKLVVFCAAFLLLACGGTGSNESISASSTQSDPAIVVTQPNNNEKPSVSASLIVDLDDPNRSLKGGDLTGKQLSIQLHPLNASNETKTYTLFENMASTTLPDAVFPSWCTGKVRYVGNKLMVDIKTKDLTTPIIPKHQADSQNFIIGDSHLHLHLLALNDMFQNQQTFGANNINSHFSQHRLTSGYINYNLCSRLYFIGAVHKFMDNFHTSATLIKSFSWDAFQLNVGATTDNHNNYFYQSFMFSKSGCNLAFSSLLGRVSTATVSFKIAL